MSADEGETAGHPCGNPPAESVVDGPAGCDPAGYDPACGYDAPTGYTDLARIDRGGSAVVYRARDIRLDRTVALKILSPDGLDERQLRRFRTECRATGRLSAHPNIVTVYEAGTTAGNRPWLAMEYCAGGSLAHRLARTGPLPVAEVISIGARLCSALSAAHAAGILHRDVKPQNVLLTSYGEPALADFGIALLTTGDDTHSVMTETAAYTVVHAAPEILEGEPGTVSSDIYSLGSTLYTLVAGQAPFSVEADTGLAPLVARILRNDVPAITRPGIPEELQQLLRRCLAAEPRDRPASAAKLGASLTSLGQRLAGTVTCRRVGPRPDRSPISARGLLVVLGGALGVLLCVFTAWGFSHPSSDGDRSPRTTGSAGPPPSAQEGTGAQTGIEARNRTGTVGAPQGADRYAPKGLALAPGSSGGELIVTWHMPIRPDVVATVIYIGPGQARASAIVTYDTSQRGDPTATLRGLPRNHQVCVSAAHVVSVNDGVTKAISRPVCAVAR